MKTARLLVYCARDSLMIEIRPRLWLHPGHTSELLVDMLWKQGWAIVSCAKYPWYVQLKGNPSPADPEYLFAERNNHLYLNWVDAEDPAFFHVPQFTEAIAFIHQHVPKKNVAVHCVPPGTILDAPIPVPIEEATIVYGHDGRLHSVLEHTSHYYEGDLLAFHTIGGFPVTVTPEHKLLVVKPFFQPSHYNIIKPTNRYCHSSKFFEFYRTQPVWKRAYEIELGDYLVSPAPVPAATSDSDYQLEPSDDMAWLLGLYAADGNCNKCSCTITLAPNNDIERACRAISLFGVKPTVVNYERWVRIRFNSVILGRAFSDWFGKKECKHLPGFLFNGRWPLRAVLDGYVHGDGTKSWSGWSVDTISYTLALQVHRICRALKLSPTVLFSNGQQAGRFPNAKPFWRLWWSESKSTHHKTCWWGDNYLMPIKRIERKPYSGLVSNIAVEGSESYLFGCVASSNCNEGHSRSPSLMMLYLAVTGQLPGSFALCEAAMKHLYPWYSPRAGIRTFIERHWNRFLCGVD